MVRERENLCLPSFDTASTIPERSDHTTYSVPSAPTAPVKPSTAPLSSRGKPSRVLISMGFDQDFPPSVEREKSMIDFWRENSVHPTYRLPAYFDCVLSATM